MPSPQGLVLGEGQHGTKPSSPRWQDLCTPKQLGNHHQGFLWMLVPYSCSGTPQDPLGTTAHLHPCPGTLYLGSPAAPPLWQVLRGTGGQSRLPAGRSWH